MAAEPRANATQEAVNLRVAAIEFARHDPDDYPGDHDDKRGAKLNRALLLAAVAYARRADAP